MAKGREPRIYECFGERITAKEAADRLGVSIHTIRNRLQECGDNMEWVMNFYHQRQNFRGGSDVKKEEQAKKDILNVLCGEEEPEREVPRDLTAEACVEATLQSSKRADLAVLNATIAALEKLKPDMFDDSGAKEACTDCMEILRSMRCRKYEHLVDWAAIARGSA